MGNKVQLISYANRMSSTISELTNLLQGKLKGYFGGIHLLPFYDPINGNDAGFDPIDHLKVDPTIGSWSDVKVLATLHPVMADLVVNHMSSESPQFQDVLKNGENSEFWDLFLKESDVFPKGATAKELETIYRPRPGRPFTSISVPGISDCQFWTTFSEKQIDINVETPAGKKYLQSILQTFSDNNIRTVRLDAAGYAIKRRGSSCFMIDETYAFIKTLTEQAAALDIEVLVEIHSHYANQIQVAKQVPRVYDFALPPLILHSLFSSSSAALKHWLEIAPRNCFTVLDTHDGIGIVDVAGNSTLPGLLTDTQINNLVVEIHTRSNGESRKASGHSASNLDVYQINCTYYDALGKSDRLYLIARAIQFFSPGIPQVYYNGLFAEPNDMSLLEKTGVGRDINRHYFSDIEISDAMTRPVVRSLLKLIHLRNSAIAFTGNFELGITADSSICLRWSDIENNSIELRVDLDVPNAKITQIEKGEIKRFRIDDKFFEAHKD